MGGTNYGQVGILGFAHGHVMAFGGRWMRCLSGVEIVAG